MGFDGGLKKPPIDALRLIIPDNACILCITAAAGTELADAYSPNIVIASSPGKEVYDPWAFYLHAALLRQAFAYCGKFPIAASRRSLGRVSVPVWLIILPDQLLIIALKSYDDRTSLVQRGLHAQVRTVRTDKVTEFLNKTLHAYFAKEDSLSLGPQSQENVPQAVETVTMANELNLLFSSMFDELLNETTPVVSNSSDVHAADDPNKCQQHNTTQSSTTTVAVDAPPLNIQTTPQIINQVPTVTATENIIQA
ncbi:hypothetical protein Tco_1517009 [Tanacetum coccineum]